MLTTGSGSTGSTSNGRAVLTALAWTWVVAPFRYGLDQLVIKIPALSGS
ncbi:MAG: MFS transporter small subunit [Pseudonocardiaceae bacterium]